MFKEEILELKEKLEELQQKYESAKKEREDLVTQMNQLDNKIASLEETIEKYPSKKNNEKAQSKTTIATLFQSLLNFLISKIKNINIEDIKKELAETIEKRYILGTKYRNIREEELSAEKDYKTLKLNLEELFETLEQKTAKTYTPIYFNDIYSKIKMTREEFMDSTENKIKIFDERLKEYLIEKIIEIKNKSLLYELLINLSTTEAMIILTSCIPKEEHHNTLSHIIHAILGFVSNLQSYSIIWYEEKDEYLISNPEIIFDEQERCSSLKTHKDTDYITIFESLYNNLLDKLSKKNIYNKRTYRTSF